MLEPPPGNSGGGAVAVRKQSIPDRDQVVSLSPQDSMSLETWAGTAQPAFEVEPILPMPKRDLPPAPADSPIVKLNKRQVILVSAIAVLVLGLVFAGGYFLGQHLAGTTGPAPEQNSAKSE